MQTVMISPAGIITTFSLVPGQCLFSSDYGRILNVYQNNFLKTVLIPAQEFQDPANWG